MISELNSTPDYDEEITINENYMNETYKENNEYIPYFFPDFTNRENENEELIEKSYIEEAKIEHNFLKKQTIESNIKLENKNKNEEKIFLNFQSKSVFYKSEKSNLDLESLFNNKNEKTEIIIDRKENKFFFSKNRKIFKVVNQNKFYIFNYGNKDKNTRKFINETLKKKKFIIFKKNEKCIKINRRQKRKYYSDNIRKKIKARFLKYLKNVINERLKGAGSKIFFSFFPQNFVCNIKKNINRGVLNITLEDFLSKNFSEKENKGNSSLEKYNHNKKVLDYLKDNQIISEASNFNNFKNMKYYDIYCEYLRSNEFEIEINRLKKKENFESIKLYIQLASNLINFFLIE